MAESLSKLDQLDRSGMWERFANYTAAARSWEETDPVLELKSKRTLRVRFYRVSIAAAIIALVQALIIPTFIGFDNSKRRNLGIV